MIPSAPSLFHVEEGEAAVRQVTSMAAYGELVGLRLIIQSSSPRQQRMAVLRRSAMRFPATSASKRQESGRSRFVGLEFLKCCFCCHKKLDGDMDVFVYKGEQAFCSAECRCRQMAKEERREVEVLVRKRRDAFHSRRAAPEKMTGSNRHATVQTAA